MSKSGTAWKPPSVSDNVKCVKFSPAKSPFELAVFVALLVIFSGLHDCIHSIEIAFHNMEQGTEQDTDNEGLLTTFKSFRVALQVYAISSTYLSTVPCCLYKMGLR